MPHLKLGAQQQQLKHIWSISVWVLQNFRITKLPQFPRSLHANDTKTTTSLLVSQRKCLLVGKKATALSGSQAARQSGAQVVEYVKGGSSRVGSWGCKVYGSARW